VFAEVARHVKSLTHMAEEYDVDDWLIGAVTLTTALLLSGSAKGMVAILVNHFRMYVKEALVWISMWINHCLTESEGLFERFTSLAKGISASPEILVADEFKFIGSVLCFVLGFIPSVRFGFTPKQFATAIADFTAKKPDSIAGVFRLACDFAVSVAEGPVARFLSSWDPRVFTNSEVQVWTREALEFVNEPINCMDVATKLVTKAEGPTISDLVAKCDDLIKRGIDLGSSRTRDAVSVAAILRSVRQRRSTLAGNVGQHLRVSPFTVAFIGDPGIGKSAMLTQFYRLMANILGVEVATVFAVNAAQKFFDGYRMDTLVMLFDDLASIKPEMAKDTLIGALLQMIGNHPFPLNMSGVDDKGEVFCTVPSIAITSNDPMLGARHIFTYPDALLRRVHFVEAQVKPQFRCDNSVQLDSTKTDGSMDYWNFQFYRYETGSTGKAIKVAQREFVGGSAFWAHLASQVREHYRQQVEFLARSSHLGTFCPDCTLPVHAAAGPDCGDHHIAHADQLGFLPLPSEDEEMQDGALADVVFASSEGAGIPAEIVVPVLAGWETLVELWHSYGTFWLLACVPGLIATFLSSWFLALVVLTFQFTYLVCKGAGMVRSLQQSVEQASTVAITSVNDSRELATKMSLRSVQCIKVALAVGAMYKVVKFLRGSSTILAASEGFTNTFSTGLTPTSLVVENRPLDTCTVDIQRGPQAHVTYHSRQRGFIVHDQKYATTTPEALTEFVAHRMVVVTVAGVRMHAFLYDRNVFIAPAHLFPGEGPWEVKLFQKFNDGINLDLSFELAVRDFRRVEGKDLCLFVAPVPTIRGVVDKMLPVDVARTVQNPRLIYLTADATGACVKKFTRPAALVDAVTLLPTDANPMKQHLNMLSYEHHGGGLCGSVLIGSVGTGAHVGIVGMHIAGNPMGFGYAVQINTAEIDARLGTLDFASVAPLAPTLFWGKFGPVAPRASLFNASSQGLELAGVVMGTVEGRVMPKAKTKLKGTSFSAQLRERCPELVSDTVVPQMDGYLRDGKWVSPEVTFLQTLEPVHSIDWASRAEFLISGWEHILARTPPNMAIRPGVLSLDQAVNGVDQTRLEALNFTTSGGFGYTGAKSQYFEGDPGARVPCARLQSDVELVLKEYEAGRCVRPPFAMTFKDEPRSAAKVADRDIRAIAGCWLPFAIVVRMYFLPVIAFITNNAFIFGCMPGLNCYGPEWARLAEYGTRARNGLPAQIIAGDFKWFDKRMSASLSHISMCVIMWVAKRFGSYSADDFVVMRGITHDLVFHLLLLGPEGIIRLAGNASGQPLTTLLNCVANLLLHIYCALRVKPNLSPSEYVSFVNPATFGDDGFTGVAGNLFDAHDMQRCMAELGYGYTDALKRTEFPKYETLESATFLKRTFRFDDDIQAMVAPLDFSSIAKQLTWIRTSSALMWSEQEKDALYRVSLELALHGRSIFERHVEVLQEVATPMGLTLPSFDHLITYYQEGRYVEMWVRD
jgi:hypothetical protein